MKLISYQETINYLYSLLPMYQREGQAALKKDLTNTLLLCEALGHPEQQFRSILIGGTNGKGSVSSMLHSICVQAGYKVGLYTSPHLLDFTERIRINQQNISQQDIMDFVNQHQDLIERIRPSFFEFTVAMAFDYFARNEVDLAVVEVGLGGRLDSTNVLKPLVSVITNVSYDHMEMLGDTLEAIAGEKAGIIKQDIPVIIGETHPETASIFLSYAKSVHTAIHFADQCFRAGQISNQWEQAVFEVTDLRNDQKQTFTLDLPGTYQKYNVVTTLKVVEELRNLGLELPLETVRSGLRQVKRIAGLKGRMDVLSTNPLVLTDTAHNVAGVEQLANQLKVLPASRKYIVWGMVREKKHDEILRLLPQDAYFIFVRPDIPRGFQADALLEISRMQHKKGETASTVAEGVQKALTLAQEDDVILIGGSTFVIAEVLSQSTELFGSVD